MQSLTAKDLNVFIKGQDVWCNSLELAKRFDRTHKSVLRTIRATILRLLVEDHDFDEKYIYDENGKDLNVNKISSNYENLKGNVFPLRNKFSKYFKDSSYVTSRGKDNDRFNLTFEGFQLIALGFTGKEARRNKRLFISAFALLLKTVAENKQLSYENNENPLWIEFRNQGKEIRTKLTDAIRDYLLPQRVSENRETSQFVERYISSYTRLIYKTLNIEIPKGVTVNRDAMDLRTLFDIEKKEEEYADIIKTLSEDGMHYKEIYQTIKAKEIK